jgi:hypothetical protein
MDRDDVAVITIGLGCLGVPLWIFTTAEMVKWCIRRWLGPEVAVTPMTVPPCHLVTLVMVCAAVSPVAILVAIPLCALAIVLFLVGGMVALLFDICCDVCTECRDKGGGDVENPQA